MFLRVADIVDESIVDGSGFRMTLFAQGCLHGCPGGHNPGTHDFSEEKRLKCSAYRSLRQPQPAHRGYVRFAGEGRGRGADLR